MDTKVFAVIFGMMLVTYIPRMLPLVVLSKCDMPPLVMRWLKFIPVAVLASLLGPEILLADNTLNLSLNNTYLLAALPSLLVALTSKNLFLTVFTGMGAMIIITRILQ